MTYSDKARLIAIQFASGGECGEFEQLCDALVIAQQEAANEELERRRAAESQLENVIAGGPVIIADERGLRLKVWHPIQKRWYETSLIASDRVSDAEGKA